MSGNHTATHSGLHRHLKNIHDKFPTTKTGSDNMKICIQEIGNTGSERLNVDCGSTLTQLPTALTGEGNLKVSIQEDHTHNLSTEAKQDIMEATLEVIATNTANIKVSTDSVNLNVDTLEALQTTTNTNLTNLESSLTSMEAKQDTQITHLSEIEGAVETLEGCVGSSKINVNISSGSSGLPSGASTSALQGDTNTKLDTLETSLTSMEAKQDTQITHLSEIEGAVETLEGCVGSSKVNVNISSGNISGFATSTLQGTTNTKLDTLESSLTSMEGKQDTQITHLSEIEGAIEVIEGCVSGSELQVDIVGGNITGYATSTLQGTTNTKLDTLESSLTSMEGKQDTQITHLSEIEGAVETLEGCVGSSKVNVNISSGNISGFATSTLQGTTNTKLDTLETSLTSLEGKIDTLDSVQDNVLTKLGEIDSVLDNIKVDTEAVETAVEAIQTHTQLTTVLLFDAETVNSGGDTHTSSAHEIIKSPSNGLNFLIKSSSGSVDAGDFTINFLVSGDNSSYSTLNTTFKQAVNDGLFQQVRVANYVPKFIKMTITNNDFSSNSDFTAHLFY